MDGCGLREQQFERLAETGADVVVGELALVVELLVCVADGQLGLGHPCAHRPEHLAQLGGGPDASERAALELITATGLLRNAFVASGREPQSSAFLSAPGIDELYSGVAKKTASTSRTSSRNAAAAAGAGTMSSSWSYGGMLFRPSQSIDLDALRRLLAQSAEEGRRVRSVSERAADREDAHRLRLLGDQGQVGLERDLVGERRLAVRERHVPVHVELRAVDGGLQLQSDAGRAEVVDRRADDRALQNGRLGDALDRDLAVDLDRVAVALERAGEADDGMTLGVEELGGEQVRLEVLLLGLNALDAGRAGELAVGERGVEVGDLAAERRDRIGNLEGDAGVDGVRLRSAGRDFRLRLSMVVLIWSCLL